MCHRTKIKHDWQDDLSYYPGINHSGEMELEEYIWLIHKDIDLALFNILLKEEVMLTTGIKKTPDRNPAFIYAPYVPMYKTPIVTANWTVETSDDFEAFRGADLVDIKIKDFSVKINMEGT